MKLGDRSRLSDQCVVHSRTGLGQTKQQVALADDRKRLLPMYRCLPRQNHAPFHGLLRKSDQRKREGEMTHKLQARVNVHMCCHRHVTIYVSYPVRVFTTVS